MQGDSLPVPPPNICPSWCSTRTNKVLFLDFYFSRREAVEELLSNCAKETNAAAGLPK